MKEIKWTKEELKRIKKILLKSNLTVNERGQLVVKSETVEYANVNNKPINPYFQYDKEISSLVYLQDMEEVYKILELAKEVNYDKNNPNHFGLIKAIYEINKEDRSEIFTIFRELIALFNSIAYDAATIIFSHCKNNEQLKKEISLFKNSTEETFEETFALFKINEILNQTNGIANSPIYRPVIERGIANLKKYILTHLNTRLAHNVRAEIIAKNSDTKEYINGDIEKKLKKKKKRITGYNNNPQ